MFNFSVPPASVCRLLSAAENKLRDATFGVFKESWRGYPSSFSSFARSWLLTSIVRVSWSRRSRISSSSERRRFLSRSLVELRLCASNCCCCCCCCWGCCCCWLRWSIPSCCINRSYTWNGIQNQSSYILLALISVINQKLSIIVGNSL